MSADLPRLTDAERTDVARWLRTAAEGGGLTLRQEARDLALRIADRLDAATNPAPGLQAGGDAASGECVGCPPCPGRGSDGHGMTHCAECCFGTGVEADPSCPVHGDPEPDAGDVEALGDHPYVDPRDGRQECYLCGKFVHDVTHSCKGVPVTRAAEARVRLLIDAARAQGAADALREAADEIDREAAEAAARRRVPAVRCLACDLRYEERDQYGCHEPGRPHTYDPTDLTEVGRVVVEPTYDGDRLRDRAARIAGQDGGEL